MKKIIIIIICCFSYVFSQAQFTNTTSTGSSTTLTQALGGYKGKLGLILPDVVTDTTVANTMALAGYAGSLIITSDKKVWYRTLAPNKWNELSNTGLGTGTVTSVATNNGTGLTGGTITTTGTLAIDTTVITSRNRTKQQTDSIIGLISSGGGGTVLSVSTTNAYGISSTVSNPTSNPNINLRVDTALIVPYTDTLKVNGIATKSDIRNSGYGTGTVTSIAKGYAITPTASPITTTGTIGIDSSVLSLKYARLNGSNATGRWPIDIFGDAVTAQTATNSLGWNSQQYSVAPLVSLDGLLAYDIGTSTWKEVTKTQTNTWLGNLGGSVTSASGSLPLSVTNPTTTPNITIDSANATYGYTTLYQNSLKLNKSNLSTLSNRLMLGVTSNTSTYDDAFQYDLTAGAKAIDIFASSSGINRPGGTKHGLNIILENGTTQDGIGMAGFGDADPGMHFGRANGTIASPTTIEANQYFLTQGGYGYVTGVGWSQSAWANQWLAPANWSSTSHPTEHRTEVTPIGSITRYIAHKTTNDGQEIFTDAIGNVTTLNAASGTFSGVGQFRNTGGLYNNLELANTASDGDNNKIGIRALGAAGLYMGIFTGVTRTDNARTSEINFGSGGNFAPTRLSFATSSSSGINSVVRAHFDSTGKFDSDADYSASFNSLSFIYKGYADSRYAPISVTGTLTAVNGGTGITTSTNGGVVTVTNSGVTALASNYGISVSGSTGSLVLTNTGIIGANNGLTNSSGIVGMGGTLSANTTVVDSTFSLLFTNTKKINNTSKFGLNGEMNINGVTNNDATQVIYAGVYGSQSWTSAASFVTNTRAMYSGVNGTNYLGNAGSITGSAPVNGLSGWILLSNTGSIANLASIHAKTPLQQVGGTTATGIISRYGAITIDNQRDSSDKASLFTNMYAIDQKGAHDTSNFAGIISGNIVNANFFGGASGTIKGQGATLLEGVNQSAYQQIYLHETNTDYIAGMDVSGGQMFIGTPANSAGFGTTKNKSVWLATNNNVRFLIDGAGVATISQLGTGAVQSTAGVLSVVSDSRLKTKYGLFNGSALSSIMKLPKPRYWQYNSKSGMPIFAQNVKQFGLFADSVHYALGEEFAPTQKDGYYSLADRALLSLTIQALQEANNKVDALEIRLAKLEALIKEKK